VVTVMDGTRDDNGVRVMAAVPVAPAVIIEGNRAVVAVVEAIAFVIDDYGGAVMMMPVVRPDDDIGLGRGSHDRSGNSKRQSGHNDCFHCYIPDF